MHRSYVPREWIDSFIVNEHYDLPVDVVSRFFSVLRIKPDEIVAVFDGAGRQVVGTLLHKMAQKSAHFLKAELHTMPRLKPEIVVVQAAIDEAKLSQTIQRGTEFGVDRFIIFPSARSEPFCFSKIEKRVCRIQRIAEDASRQSARLYIPSITMMPSLSAVLQLAENDIGFGVFGDLEGGQKLSEALHERKSFEKPFWVVVGPEGGLSQEERTRLKEAGVVGVVWAPYVLRSELACLSAIAIFNANNGRA